MHLKYQSFLLYGHETDFTIADFVSDLRAPTPSAAAELAVPEISKVEENLQNYQNRYRMALRKKVDYMKLQFEKTMKARCYQEPLEQINEKYMAIDTAVKKIVDETSKKMILVKKEFESHITKLDALSPLKTLARGYSITKKEDQVIKKAKELKKGDKISIRFVEGEVVAEVL